MPRAAGDKKLYGAIQLGLCIPDRRNAAAK